jgi:uncharacterized protein DUF1064
VSNIYLSASAEVVTVANAERCTMWKQKRMAEGYLTYAHKLTIPQRRPMPKAASSAKVSKYGAVPTVVDNVRFGSKREAGRYQDLKLLQKAGVIRGLTCDKKELRWSLDIEGFHICVYEADFLYEENIGGEWIEVVEDSKGFKTPAYKLKKKLMKAIHNIEIREV